MIRDTELGRREILAAMGTAAAFATLPAQALAAAQGSSKDARLHALLMRHFEQALHDDPTQATSLGLDTGANAALRSRFPDWSAPARARAKATIASNLAELRALGPDGLSETARISYDSSLFDLDTRERIASFPYHSGGFGHRPGPYGVTQLGGFYTGVSNFLDTQHPVKSRADAEAYMARMEAIPGLIDADTAIVRDNAAMGVVAPRFILDQAITQLKQLRDGETKNKTLVRSITQRAGALGLTGYEDRASRLFEGPIRASLTRQIDTITGLLPRAKTTAGVADLPRGQDYYAAALRFHTTTDMKADEIHRLGLDQVADLNARIDTLLKAQGYTQGSIRDRLDALDKTPGQVFANNDAGRAELLAYLNDRLDTIRPRLPRMFSRMPKARYEIRRVPPEIEGGAPGGSAQRGSLDGSRPGIFFINLRDTAEWPRYTLPTLAFHEGAPGHLFEGALSLENGDLPIYRQVAPGTAYGEGWGLYSEQVADELGMYEDDPLGKIGYLGSFAFRASRLVVDTGLHSKGWSREQAIDYMVANSSQSASSARTEIDRYIVYPGQATAYKVGQIAISRLRAEAEKSKSFDIKRFHDVILGGGRMPLAVLERRVTAAFPI